MADVRLSNVIGAPFSEHVLTQLDLRAYHNSTGAGVIPGRTGEEVLFLANKTAWVRLTSSVRVIPSENRTLRQFYEMLGLGTNYASPEDLAKNWILEAGTSIGNGAGINLREGIGPEGAYGLGGTEELGYRPMPGLTSVMIDTKGTLGSLREATINFRVWNMNQLNVIEALYFRLGYSMLLEWGHTQFYVNTNQTGGTTRGTFRTNTYGLNPFQPVRKEVVQQSIGKKAKELSGNYDGMLGVVTNFTWSFNQDGGYDCVVKLVGLGAIIDSLKINLSYKMPDVIFQEYQYQNQLIQQRLREEAAKRAELEEQRRREGQGLPPVLPALPTSAEEIYSNIYTADLGTPNPALSQEDFLSRISFYTANPNNFGVNTIYDYYYKAEKGGNPANSNFVQELNTIRTGLFLSPLLGIRNKWQVLFANAPSPVSLSDTALTLAATKSTTLEPDPVLDDKRYYPVYDPWDGIAYGTRDLEKALGTNNFVKLFDLVIRDSRGGSLIQGLNSLGNIEVDPDELVYAPYSLAGNNIVAQFISAVGNTVTLGSTGYEVRGTLSLTLAYKAQVRNSAGQVITKVFKTILSYKTLPNTNDPAAEKNRPTRKELTDALQTWFNNGRKVSITGIEPLADSTGARSVVVKGTLIDISIPGKSAPQFDIIFDNSANIQTVLPPPPPPGDAQQQQAQPANSGDVGGTENQASTTQTDQAQRFASALHAMLSAVKSQVQTKSLSVPQKQSVYTDSLVDLTSTLYKDGVLDGIFNYTAPEVTSPREITFDLKKYAIKGFNSNLMSDPDYYTKVDNVDFNSLCTAYAIRYVIKGKESKINFPIYVKFGYLLAFLNNMCLVYDSTQDTKKHPYVYLDFNPNTNFCLSSPQQLSVDPLVCMIPFEGNGLEAYTKLYPEQLQETISSAAEPFFNATTNAVSGFLNSFKSAQNAYQGKTMEILLNVDFLLNTLNNYTTKDPEHSINLKGFLDAIVTNVNKALGNFNLFRVAYRDDSNTVIIKDDQFVPPIPGEDYMLDRGKYLTQGTAGVAKYGQLPVFGAQSLVREMEFKTNMTTNLSNVIAISAQANIGSANSTDYSPYSYLNVNYEDAYKPKITNSTDNVSQQSANTTGSAANDLTQAIQFNNHLLNVYYDGQLSETKIEFAKNYYIERMSKIKSQDEVTVSAPFIPANLSLTVDGISGIVMGNAFTIPENRLPLSLRGTKDQTKVGFIVVGLTHTVDKNQWLTKISGQMIRLRDTVKYQPPAILEKVEPAFAQPGDVGGAGVTTSSGCRTAYPNLTIKETVQVETYPIAKAATYLKTKYPDVGKATFAVMIAEARTAGDNFRSAGGNNFGGVQTDAGVWGFGNFDGQFCRRDSTGQLRMFASFPTPEAFLDFLANRVKAKGFTSTSGDVWTSVYIDRWWSPREKASYVKGSTVFNNKLSIFNRASRLYDQA